MAAALAGERSTLDTVVYTCCDMLNACELAGDVERAAQWCEVADDFVKTYGCPFLYAECRIYLRQRPHCQGPMGRCRAGAVGRPADHRQACPGLHGRALSRLAGLRVRQGRLEEAEQLLDRVDQGVDAEAEASLWRATLLLARGDAGAASRALARRLHDLAEHRLHLGGSPRPHGRRAHRRRRARRCHRGGGSAERDRRHRERRAADGDGGGGERSGVDRLR